VLSPGSYTGASATWRRDGDATHKRGAGRDRSSRELHKRLHTRRTFDGEELLLERKSQRAAFLQSPLTDSNRRTDPCKSVGVRQSRHAGRVLVARYGHCLRARDGGDRVGLHRFRGRRRTQNRSRRRKRRCRHASSLPPRRSQAPPGCSSSALLGTVSRTSGSTAVSLLPTLAGGLRSVLWSTSRLRRSFP
jgi:hypothetical protein